MFLRKLCVMVLPLVMAALLCLVLPMMAGIPFWTEVFKGLTLGVALALVLSCLFAWLPLLGQVKPGLAVVICTVVAAAVCALVFPVEEEEAEQ